jgi:hypothetical protein
VLGWPKRCQLAHAFPWEYSDINGISRPNFWGQLGALLTRVAPQRFGHGRQPARREVDRQEVRLPAG